MTQSNTNAVLPSKPPALLLLILQTDYSILVFSWLRNFFPVLGLTYLLDDNTTYLENYGEAFNSNAYKKVHL